MIFFLKVWACIGGGIILYYVFYAIMQTLDDHGYVERFLKAINW